MKRLTYVTMLMCMLGLAGLDRVHAAEKPETSSAPAKTTKFVPRLTKGDRFVLEVTKTKNQTGRSGMGGMKGFQVIDVEIMKSSGANRLIGWTIRRTGILDADDKLIPLPTKTAGLMTIYDGIQIIFEFSPDYGLIGLKNLKQIKPLLFKTIDKVLEDSKGSPQEKANLRQAFTPMLSSPNGIQQIFGKEITLLLGLAQLELEGDLDKNAGSEADCELPMPFGGGVIPAKIAMNVTNVDRSAQRATVTINTKMDPEKTAQAVLAAIRTISKKMGKPAPTERDIPKVDIKDIRTYVVDLKTNLPLSVDHSRTSVMGPGKRTETTKIVRKPAKAITKPSDKRK